MSSDWRSGNREARLIRPVPFLAIVVLSELGSPLGGLGGFGPGFVETHQSAQRINGMEVFGTELGLAAVEGLQQK